MKFIPFDKDYILVESVSNLMVHTQRELALAGMEDSDEYNSMVSKCVLDLIDVFSKQGHSGFSASMVREIFYKLSQFKTLEPITNNPNEWEDVSHYSDDEPNTIWQNKRDSSYFSYDQAKTWKSVDESERIMNEALILEGGGIEAGKMELVKITLTDAKAYIESKGLNLENFEEKFKHVQKFAKLGKTKRKDMPVITSKDVEEFQHRLESGNIDITAPFAPTTNKKKPFPTGLTGKKAEEFLERGLADGDADDDKIQLQIIKKKVSDLKPIQQQIYFDQSVDIIENKGIEKSIDYLSNKSFFIISSDNFIIDGHHRWLTSNLIDLDMEVNTLEIDLPIKKLLELATAYGDAIGNKRNK